MSGAQHTPEYFRGFLGNGAWMLAVHTKKCARQRRGVTPGARARALVPNRSDEFAAAMRARVAKATGKAA